MGNYPSILFQTAGSHEENYLPILKSILAGKANVLISQAAPSVLAETAIKARRHNADLVATSSPKVLSLLLGRPCSDKDLNAYQGSIYPRNGIEYLILPKMETLYTKTYGRFVYERFLSKFLKMDNWLQPPEFSWELFEPGRADELLAAASFAAAIAIDIETIKEPLAITCCGFTLLSFNDAEHIQLRTVVVPATDMFRVQFIRNMCATTPPKILQNGKYDIAHLLRYAAPITNYSFDTINAFHCWYSELPKDLGFIAAMMVRSWQYHKKEADNAKDLMEYYQYNAKDCFATTMAFLQWLIEAPAYATRNYLLEFPTVFPCILAEQTGIKVDLDTMEELNKQVEATSEVEKARLQVMVGCSSYNPNSSQQTLRLFQLLGSGDIKSSDEKHRDKVMSRHPLNKKILTSVDKYRESRKLLTSYTRNVHPDTGETKIWHGRHFYVLNPHGTDTARLASKGSAFWVGDSIQTIPRDSKDIQIKSMYVADDGFYLGEADGEQAEARDTAYLTGDTALIAAVDDSTRDYHGINASAFFGVSYNAIVQSSFIDGYWNHKTLDKALRDLSKRTNHGANYNMGAFVLLDTMGIENVLRAKQLLGLPAKLSLIQVCQWLLNKFDETYPVVRGDYHKYLKGQIKSVKMLISPLGWTRYCFGDPEKSKPALNAYAAHPSQNLNAGVLNKAWLKVFYNIWLPNQADFKLLAQIHDSILFQYRIGREDLAWQVKKEMEIPVPVTDIFGKKRTLLVPVALKGESTRWHDLKEMRMKIAA